MTRPIEPTGLLFVHPDFDDAAETGLVNDATGRLQLVSGAALVRQSLLMLLSTMPGERVMRPDYGCELLTLAFSPNDHTSAGLAKHFVMQAVERFEPRVQVLRIAAGPNADHPWRLDVVLVYQPRFGGVPQTLTVGLPLDGAPQED